MLSSLGYVGVVVIVVLYSVHVVVVVNEVWTVRLCCSLYPRVILIVYCARSPIIINCWGGGGGKFVENFNVPF